MTEIEMLQVEIKKLQETVADLQNGTVRILTNTGKLQFYKQEIISDVFGRNFKTENPTFHGDVMKHLANSTNDVICCIFKKPCYSKMGTFLFEGDDADEKLKAYLDIYRDFATQYKTVMDKYKMAEILKESKLQRDLLMSRVHNRRF